MKKYVLIKKLDQVNLAHLYEHIYCAQLVEHFRKRGLYSYLDYNIDAKTYYTGLIRLEIIFYTPKALNEADSVHTFMLSLNLDVINVNLLKIFAEERVDALFLDDNIMKDIALHDAQKWFALESIGIMNIKVSAKPDTSIVLRSRSPRHFPILRQIISMDVEDININKEAYLPLFAVISRALTNNLQEVIADTSYCYSYDDTFSKTKSAYSRINCYRIDDRQAMELTTEAEETTELLRELHVNNFITELQNYFQNATYNNLMMAPDDEEIIHDTNMIVGGAGWGAVGTSDNILYILQHMYITFTLNKDRTVILLGDIFK